ncbi:MAG TPA: ATP-binding protein [Treponemataceae bacterium]|nr:ATP-binding protein [Treponemataceae bacterium]
MKIAIASGKGGTGKTTLAVALALSTTQNICLLDCDVEEPNAGLFLNLENSEELPVTVPIPVVNESTCTACGECSRFCEFNAIVCIGTSVMVFPELCHSCGGCTLVCPVGAIHEEDLKIGTMTDSFVGPESKASSKKPVRFIQGLLDIGYAMSPPIIRAVKNRGGFDNLELEKLFIIDAPPGTSCPMGTAVTGADYVILVTEPTPFGLHDLDLAVKTVRKMGIPFGVVINRCDSGDDRVVTYCKKENIALLLQIPEDRRIAEGYSNGKSLVESAPEYREKLNSLVELLIDQHIARGKTE